MEEHKIYKKTWQYVTFLTGNEYKYLLKIGWKVKFNDFGSRIIAGVDKDPVEFIYILKYNQLDLLVPGKSHWAQKES